MSKKGAYYNEHEPFAAEWLRNLIKRELIAPGDVDEWDIQEVKADELDGYRSPTPDRLASSKG